MPSADALRASFLQKPRAELESIARSAEHTDEARAIAEHVLATRRPGEEPVPAPPPAPSADEPPVEPAPPVSLLRLAVAALALVPTFVVAYEVVKSSRRYEWYETAFAVGLILVGLSFASRTALRSTLAGHTGAAGIALVTVGVAENLDAARLSPIGAIVMGVLALTAWYGAPALARRLAA